MDTIIKQFSDETRNSLRNHLVKIYLFGSRARKDFTDKSDYDFLIVVDQKTKEISEAVLDISSKISSDKNELLSTLIWDRSEWDLKVNYPLGVNILKEGIEI